jgi:hypothetical protein
MSQADTSVAGKEARILKAMRDTLTRIIRDTTTPPGMKHPLAEETVEDIRQCLLLITARERELASEQDRPMNLRPHFADEPTGSAAVPVDRIGGRGGDGK